MTNYKVIKSHIETEYASVIANSEDEAIKKSIEKDI